MSAIVGGSSSASVVRSAVAAAAAVEPGILTAVADAGGDDTGATGGLTGAGAGGTAGHSDPLPDVVLTGASVVTEAVVLTEDWGTGGGLAGLLAAAGVGGGVAAGAGVGGAVGATAGVDSAEAVDDKAGVGCVGGGADGVTADGTRGGWFSTGTPPQECLVIVCATMIGAPCGLRKCATAATRGLKYKRFCSLGSGVGIGRVTCS